MAKVRDLCADYRAIFACYRSGQMSEQQWQAHLADPFFRLWIDRRAAARR